MQDAEKASVLAAFDKWIEAVTTTYPETVTSFYAKDAVLWGTVSPIMRTTPEKIKDYFEHFMAMKNLQAIYSHPEIRVYGDIAINSGYYTFFHERDGKMLSIPARYSFVYKREGDNWMIVDHHSSVVPA